MVATYSNYMNVVHGSSNNSAVNSIQSSRRNSEEKTEKKMGKWAKFVDALKPFDEPQVPVGLYGPKAAAGQTSSSKVESKVVPTRIGGHNFTFYYH